MGKTRIEDSPFNKLIGQWETEGRRLENPETEIKGKDIYSPILDGFFILHKADVEIGKEKSQTYEIIGPDQSGNQAKMQHYNNSGASGIMLGRLKGDSYSINGEKLRFKGRFGHNNNTLTGMWQQLTDKKEWRDFIVIKLTKIKS